MFEIKAKPYHPVPTNLWDHPYWTVCKRRWVRVGDDEGYPYWARRWRNYPATVARRLLGRIGRPRNCPAALRDRASADA